MTKPITDPLRSQRGEIKPVANLEEFLRVVARQVARRLHKAQNANAVRKGRSRTEEK
jgi:hypothetical protein